MIKARLFASTPIFLSLISALVAYYFKLNQHINFYLLLLLSILSILANGIAFQYQRITLTIARCLKATIGYNFVSIPQIQILLTAPIMVPLLIIESIIYGLVIGCLFRVSSLYAFLLMLIKYIATTFMPLPTPYKLLFRLIKTELEKSFTKYWHPHYIPLLAELFFIVHSMPHNRYFEDWAERKYGYNILFIR